VRCGFTLVWPCAGVVRSLRVPRSLFVPAERAESRARLGGSSAVAGGELLDALGDGWLRDSALFASAHNSLRSPASVKQHARAHAQSQDFFLC